ncbi:MAG: prepilin-type N-terminal cleavage/methylation domain-containing protein [Alteromonadales bacterium]|nr:prepilin-type N-terminal cleavage/methylation domain-containing protein [Alteromonadales bacterium]
MKKNMNRKQQGFTLIELVVVIVILGVLAVTAAPKFIDLQDDAKTSTLNAIKASMQSAASLVNSKSLIKGNQTSATANVDVNGVTVGIAFGYPISKDITNITAATTWGALLDAPDFDILIDATNSTVIVAPKDLYGTAAAANTAANVCTVTYTQATSTTDETYVVKGC